MMQSEALGDLQTALAKAQGGMTNATLNRVNPHFKNKYADLASVIDAVRKPLSEHGLSITQTTRCLDGGQEILVTTLRHSSGQWISSEYRLTGTTDQQRGSSRTYGRRYEISSILLIAADEDDDAEATRKGNGKDMVPGKITEAQATELWDLAIAVNANNDKFLKYMGITCIDDLPASRFSEAKAALESKRK